MDYFVIGRGAWGARTDLPRRGHLIGPASRTEVFIHHTVLVDDDATRNEWETLDEVQAQMRKLQTIRPDLGLDSSPILVNGLPFRILYSVNRQRDAERCAPRRRIFESDYASVCRNDASANSESEPGTIRLCGVERFEDFVAALSRDPRAIVAHDDRDGW